jgi:hypothetical protein
VTVRKDVRIGNAGCRAVWRRASGERRPGIMLPWGRGTV